MALSEHVDVLIVGAGLSGIGAAHHLQAPPEEAGLRAARQADDPEQRNQDRSR